MANDDFKVKQVARSEMQAEKSWWSQTSNVVTILVLSLLTCAAIYIATQALGPADESADALRGGAVASGPCSLAEGEPLTAAVPAPTGSVGSGKPQWGEPFPMLIDPSCDYRATIQTSKGPIEIDLFEAQAPRTVNNFVALAESGFYEGIPFHRVIPGFVAQVGDPLGTGAGGPGYSFEDEFFPELRHDREGILSMANAGANTNGSQFFITYGPTPHLDPYGADGQLKPCGTPNNSCHAIFGEVTSGMENATALTPIEPGSPGTADTIESVTIRVE